MSAAGAFSGKIIVTTGWVDWRCSSIALGDDGLNLVGWCYL